MPPGGYGDPGSGASGDRVGSAVATTRRRSQVGAGSQPSVTEAMIGARNVSSLHPCGPMVPLPGMSPSDG